MADIIFKEAEFEARTCLSDISFEYKKKKKTQKSLDFADADANLKNSSGQNDVSASAWKTLCAELASA